MCSKSPALIGVGSGACSNSSKSLKSAAVVSDAYEGALDVAFEPTLELALDAAREPVCDYAADPAREVAREATDDARDIVDTRSQLP